MTAAMGPLKMKTTNGTTTIKQNPLIFLVLYFPFVSVCGGETPPPSQKVRELLEEQTWTVRTSALVC